MTEWAVFKRIYDLTEMEFSLAFRNFYSFLNEDRAEDNGDREKTTKSNSDDKVKRFVMIKCALKTE